MNSFIDYDPTTDVNEQIDNVLYCEVCGREIQNNYNFDVCYNCESIEPWLCVNCLNDIFPFNYIVNNNEYLSSICGTNCPDQIIGPDRYSKFTENKKLVVFPEDLDNRSILNHNGIDPDANLFADFTWDSLYCAPDALSTIMASPHILSTMHLNCRSVLYKVGEVNDLLNSLPVSILALTETWLSDHLTDSINIPGYHLIHRSRTSGEGEGVGLLV